MAHTGLLGGIMIILSICNTLGTEEDACTKCYHPLYDRENLKYLLRLSTCREDGKVYWLVRNTASYRQRLYGECSIGDPWLCFEYEANQNGLEDLIKEKPIKTQERDDLQLPELTNQRHTKIMLMETIPHYYPALNKYTPTLITYFCEL
uniref:Uncharacterized protein n=1 Tax=Catharus ustulatus TaxID=91951 RepID=A0A8C3Y5J0_CATUS